MTKVTSLVIVLGLLLASQSTVADKLRIGLLEYPPHVSFLQKQATGSMPRYLKSMYRDDFSKVEFILLPNKRGLRELSRGHIDILFPYLEQGDQLPVAGKAIFNVVPGLCFKKDKYIPFLSAPGVLDGLVIGVPTNLPLVPTFDRSSVTLEVIQGNDALNRGIQLLLKGRLDGFYHPSPVNVYHHSNPLSKSIACSLFYGFSSPVSLGMSPLLSSEVKQKITEAYTKQLNKQLYEFFMLDEVTKAN
ncbi:hypothetical protein [Pseudoalteromonas rubra]|uniref:hypothetical protein n=1 Tax=Pseudoalteromonas rubra TaxID=43658 RepID=UPI000A77367E|nr:hypothetical protein [Pseudoalteromonas rubra]